MIIGLAVGVFAIKSSLKGPATVALAAPTALLILPIFDTTMAILRRKLTGRSIYSTDRGHLHHCLLRHGMPVWCVLLVVSGCCLVTVAGVLTSLALKNEMYAVVSALAVVAMFVVTRLFGSIELNLVRQRLQALVGSFLRSPHPSGAREMEVRLQGSVDWKELWALITACAPDLNLSRVRFDVNAPAINEGYHARWDRSHLETEEAYLWRAEIPLTVHGRTFGQVEVEGCRDETPIWQKIETLSRLIQDFEAAASLLTIDALAQARPKRPATGSGVHPVFPEKIPTG
jgi:UDP-GlcNAc:undecaprenyl-phosphate GlcNAc-1-phosphate transferase